MTTITEIQTTQVYQVFIKATPEAIWEAITKPEFTEKYFYGARIDVNPKRYLSHGPNGDVELVRWGYTFEPQGNGTKVIESWQVLPGYPDFVTAGDPNLDVKARIDGMAQMARDGIKDTLANLKRAAES